MTSDRSILVLGRHPERRLVAADAFRSKGAVVVEATTVHQAGAILRQFRFDVLAVDSFGLGVGVIELIHELGVDHSGAPICVIGLSGNSDELARFHGSHLPHGQATCGEEQLGTGKAKHYCEGESDPTDGLNRPRSARRQ